MKKIIFVAILCFAASIVFSATIKLKDGSFVTGKIVSSNANKIVLEDERGKTTVLSTSDLDLPRQNGTNSASGSGGKMSGNGASDSSVITNQVPESIFPFHYNAITLAATGGYYLLSSYFYLAVNYDRAIIPWCTFGLGVFAGYSSYTAYVTMLYFVYGFQLNTAVHLFTLQGLDLLKLFGLGPMRDRYMPFLHFGLDPYIGFGVAGVWKTEVRTIGWEGITFGDTGVSPFFPLIAGLNLWILNRVGLHFRYELSLGDLIGSDGKSTMWSGNFYCGLSVSF